jgi:hypothetical protein
MEFDHSPPQLQPKKESTLLRVLLAGCGCLILIAIVVALFFGKMWGFTRGPSRAVEQHLKAINTYNFTGAYNHFSKSYRHETSYEQFRRQIDNFSTVLPYSNISLNKVNVTNNRADVDGTMTGKDGAIIPIHYELVQEEGGWKITDYEWTSPGERQTI